MKLYNDKSWSAGCCGPGSCIEGEGSYEEGAEVESNHGVLVALGQKNGKISDDAKFRNTPFIKSRTNKCKIETFTSVGDKNCKENTGWVFGKFVKEF